MSASTPRGPLLDASSFGTENGASGEAQEGSELPELDFHPQGYALPSMHERDRATMVQLIRQVAGCRLRLAASLLQRMPRGTLQRATVPQLEVLGCTPSQARRLVSAFQLTRRLWAREAAKQAKWVTTPALALELALRELHGHEQEHLLVIGLDAHNQVLGTTLVALGSPTRVEVHPREVFRDALRLGAQAIILAHNHPSGRATPSEMDLVLTQRLRQVGVLVGVPLLDHLVIGSGEAVSVMVE